MSARSASVLALVLACALAAPLQALEHAPLLRLDASGGQIFFKTPSGYSRTIKGTATGSLNWLFADGVALGESDTVIPSVSGQYLRRNQVNHIGGGGTLVTETLDNNAGLRWIHAAGSWSFKPTLAYKGQLVVSLPGETFGKGFFDMNQVSAALEIERKGERLKSLRQGFSAAKTRYYHYEASRSPLFGLELLLHDRALDFVAYGYTIGADLEPWENGLLSASAEGSYLDYSRQRVLKPAPGVADAFRIGSKTRRDLAVSALAGLTHRGALTLGELPVEWSAGMTAAFLQFDSNQNNFDAGQSAAAVFRLNRDFYSYREASAGPLLSATVAKRWRASLLYNAARRRYDQRETQDSEGAYAGGRVITTTQSVSGSLSCQLHKSLSAQASGGYFRSESNTKFDSYYLYNFSYPYYFVGLSYSL
jgi:hypothetical protein